MKGKIGCGRTDSVFFEHMQKNVNAATDASAEPVQNRAFHSLRGQIEKNLASADKKATHHSALIDCETALALLEDNSLSVSDVLSLGELPRRFFHDNRVHVHILNNIRNGNCAEDCGYCAQRKTAAGVPVYAMKPDEEILREAADAKESGAHRYCLVTAGRNTGPRMAEVYARLIHRITDEVGIRVCLSAGLIDDPAAARILAEAGLDRYNHNLNTSDSHYGNICSTHSFRDRLRTLEHVSSFGIGLCSGIIAGMGESRRDLVTVAFELNRLRADSIPVNFFLPVEGHGIEFPEMLSADDCLRILSVFRLVNPAAEVRMAAGREVYLKERQAEGLRVANSLFVSGYLNVKGSPAGETLRMIYGNGYCLDEECEKAIVELRDMIFIDADPLEPDSQERNSLKTNSHATNSSRSNPHSRKSHEIAKGFFDSLPMKDIDDLRPRAR